jgi:dTDP-4-dehydrorhamnose reductase
MRQRAKSWWPHLFEPGFCYHLQFLENAAARQQIPEGEDYGTVMRVAILGASGLLGKYLVRKWTGDEILPFNSSQVDIRDSNQVEQLIERHRPDWIVLAAAYTDVDGCESNPDLAFSTNTAGALNTAEAAEAFGGRLLFLSSDYVFDGLASEPYHTDAPRNPQSVYGRTKADAETGILRIIPNACIVRTSWVFGTGGKCFPDTILKLAQTRPALDVVDDQRGAPTYARHLALAIIELCREDAEGIVHVTNTGSCTWFEFASEIIRQSGLSTTTRPTTSDKFPRPAKRPAYSVLSLEGLETWGIQMPSWQEALQEYLSERDRGKQ